jgi:carbon storage regulator
MLVLSRKSGERIRIGENITIEVRRVAGNRVTLALDAPRTVRILRGELEQAAKEFREPAECTDGAAPSSRDGRTMNSGENETEPGPEPYAVIHRRLHVMPQLSPPMSDHAVT